MAWLWVFAWLTLASAQERLDLNTASTEELEVLPGVGPIKAQSIVDWRATHGGFERVDQLSDVPGIGPATVANLRQRLMVTDAEVAEASPPPVSSGARVNINTANASALAAIPGISESRAIDIIADRDRNGPFADCQDLSRVAGVGPATVASIADLCTSE